ncbi:transposase [Streptomyces sp. NPDC047869]|uniref:IS110 family transposase n=1 Tax=Streptomyces sp. NPDC047869 TaxID=3154709 RepID=UPI0034568853
MPEIWAGVDIGKGHHHCVVIDTNGERLLSRRVENDETELLTLIGDVLAISEDVLWAVDLNHGGAALLSGLLSAHDQPIAYGHGRLTAGTNARAADHDRRAPLSVAHRQHFDRCFRRLQQECSGRMPGIRIGSSGPWSAASAGSSPFKANGRRGRVSLMRGLSVPPVIITSPR